MVNSSKMELKHNNSDNEIVLASKYNLLQQFFQKFVKIANRNESCKCFFSIRCLDCPKNKIVYNFLIISPNRMNQSSKCRQTYNVLRKKIFN